MAGEDTGGAQPVDLLERALELAIQLELSGLDALAHRLIQSLRSELPEGVVGPVTASVNHRRRLVEAAEKVRDLTLRQRLETMPGSAKGR